MSTGTRSERAQRVIEICQERNLTIVPYGKAVWISGPGVDVIAVDLSFISPKDLDPRVGPNFVQ